MLEQKKLAKFIREIKKDDDGLNYDFMLPYKESQKILMYQTAFQDLQHCKNLCDEYSKTKSKLVREALFTSIVISYSRCFMSSNMPGGKLEVAALLKEVRNAKEMLGLHNKLINTRNTFIAHRDLNVFEGHFVYLNLNTTSGEFKFKFISDVKRKEKPVWIEGYKLLIEKELEALTKLQEINTQKFFERLISDDRLNKSLIPINVPTKEVLKRGFDLKVSFETDFNNIKFDPNNSDGVSGE